MQWFPYSEQHFLYFKYCSYVKHLLFFFYIFTLWCTALSTVSILLPINPLTCPWHSLEMSAVFMLYLSPCIIIFPEWFYVCRNFSWHSTRLSLFIEQSSTVHLHHNIVSCYVCIRFLCCETVTCDYIFATTKCGTNETNKNRRKKDTMQ